MTSPPVLLDRAWSARAGGAGLEQIAELVLDGIGHGAGPVPIEKVCQALGADLATADIKDAAGMLLSGGGLSKPLVVVRGSDAARRRRFTAAHEIAHLLLGHIELRPVSNGPEEAQADRLAALLLTPPSRVAAFLGSARPDVGDVERLARAFDVSIEAAARAYAELNPEPVAVVIVRDGKVERCYRDRSRFPYVVVAIGDPAPEASAVHGEVVGCGTASRSFDGSGASWVRFGAERRQVVVEQVKRWRSGASLVLLRFAVPDRARPCPP